jgi:pimeloyl-ACP methyl ester carboxylesterase
MVANSGTSYTPSSALSAGTTYYWRVRGRGPGAIYGNWSGTFSFTTAQTLAAPTLAAPANGATVIANVSTLFSWNSVAGATGYDLQFDSDTPLNTGSDTTFSLVTSATGAHTWRVRAKNAAGPGAYSTARSFTVADQTLPAPTLSAPANGATGVSTTPTFSWSAVTGASAGYWLAVATSSAVLPTDATASTCPSCVLMVANSGTSYTPSSALSAGTTYYWRVRGRGPGAIYGNWSGTFSFTTAQTLVAPTLTAPANGATVIANVSTPFNWGSVAGATGYDLQFDSDAPLDRGSATSFDLISSTLGAHTWRVRAKNTSGPGPYSTARSFTVTDPTLPAPTLSTPANGATGVSTTPTFSWSAVTGASAGYWLAVATSSATLPTDPTDSTCSSCALMVANSGTSYTPSSALSAGTTYYWRVRGRGPGTTYGNWSSIFSFTTASVAQYGNISARLKKVDGTDAPVSAGTPRFKLYTSPNQILSGANPETFSTIPVGTYLLEGFQTGTFWGEEFWNSQQVTVAAGATTTAILTRKYPYATSVVMKNVETGAIIAAGQTIAAGTQVRFEVTVRNDVPGTPLSTQVHFVLDLSQGGSFDYDWPLSPAQVIAGSGGTALYTFTTAINGFQTGQFYYALQVRTDTGTSVVPTDSWTWTQACGISRISTISGTIDPPYVNWTPTLAFIQRYPATLRIDPNLRTWIIIHGRQGSSTDSWVTALAGTIAGIYPSDQILLLDWSTAANSIGISTYEEDWIRPVAAWAAGKLVDYGFAGSQLNLIGHSWGGYMTDELAELFFGGVNTIVALDPAHDGFGNYNPEDPGQIDFRAHSQFSWAFHSSLLGSSVTPTNAHEAFIVDTGLDLRGGAHGAVHDLFTYMLTNSSGGVSSKFQLSRLLAHQPGPWMPNLFTTDFNQGWPYIETPTIGYEGRIYAVTGGQSPYFLRYTNSLLQLVDVLEYVETVPPTISAFSASPNTALLGNAFTISYTVSDSGGSGLNRVVLRRTSGNGLANDPGWQDIQTNTVTGNGPVSGNFSDTPPSAGTYWYGAAAFDNANNSQDERQAGLGPTQVTVSLPTVAMPTISPNGGSYSGSVQVTLACSTSGAFIYYTIDGSAPTTSSTSYEGPFTLTTSVAVKAKAFESGYNPSATASASFTITPTRIISLCGNLVFGNVLTNTTATRTLTITNTGNSTLSVASISYPPGFSGAWSGNILSGGWQNVTVTFAPTAVTSYGGTVTVSSDATSGNNSINGSGSGTALPTRIVGVGGNLAFGNVLTNTTATRTLTISNNGNSALNVSGISYPTGFSGTWSGSIVANDSQNVTVTFAPTAVTSYGGTVTVVSDATSGVNTANASGAGTIAPPQTGSLQVNLAPPGAVSAGALWQVDSTAWQSSGATVPNLSVGNHTIAFNTVSGWTTPADQSVPITANQTTPATGTYVPIAPVITVQPLSRTNVVSSSVMFSVTAAGTPPLSFQWRKEGTNVSGATDRTYTIVGIQTNDGGDYNVVVSNIYGGAVTSSVAVLTVRPLVPPAVLAGPVTDPGNGHMYYLLNQSTWVEAEAAAVALGGHLATIRSAAEQAWVHDSFNRWGGTERHLWIGLYDSDPLHNATTPETRKSEFVWASGEQVTYTLWADGEPNNWQELGEFWVHTFSPLAGSVSGYWNDAWDTDFNTFSPINGVVEVIPRPQLIGMTLSNDGFRFVLNGAVGSNYVIQVSSDLVHWTPFSTNTIPAAGFIVIVDPGASGYSKRFYRAVPLSAVPSGLVLVGHTSDGAFANGVAVAGSRAYVAAGDGLHVYDVSNPAYPVSLGQTNTGSAPTSVAITSHYAVLANYNDGLRIYDVANPSNLVSVGHTNNGRAQYVTVSGNYAYLANDTDGLRIYDISNPANPLSVGHATTVEKAFGVTVSGHYAYLANTTDGLRIYDVANPASPLSVGHAFDAGSAWSVAVSGNYAYVANSTDGLRIYDVSNPAIPFSVGNTNDGGSASDVAVAGNLVFLANGSDGLRVYDVSNPANPVGIAHRYDGGGANGVALSGQYIYVANSGDGLRIYAFGVVHPSMGITRSGGGNTISISGLTGDVYRVLASSNLFDWQTIATVTNLTGSVQFIDTGVSNFNRRFYRTVMP